MVGRDEVTITRSAIGVSAGAVLLYAVGLAADYPELILLATGCLAALGVAVAWVLRAGPQLQASRDCSPVQPSVGQRVTVDVLVENFSTRPSRPVLGVEVVDGAPYEIAVPALAVGSRYTARYEFVAARRGRLLISPLMFGSSDPLRLLTVTRPAGPAQEVRVHPRWHSGILPLTLGADRDAEGPTSLNSPQGGVAFHSLRDYQMGDPWRLINWRATARRGIPTVRHQVIPDEPHQVIVLDTATEAYTPEAFEDAVRVAATLAVAIRRAGFALELRTSRGGGSVIMERAAGSGDHTAALDLLCDVGQVAQGPDLPAVLAGLAARGEGAILGVITGRLSGTTPGGESRGAADGGSSARQRFLDTLGAVRQRFQAAYVIQVAAPPESGIPGLISAGVADSEEFAKLWNRLTRV
jgi:uncharacterized protein (DUF58 family)